MAETKQEKQTFKWGDSEYLLDDLLKLHAEQEQNFYNFAKAKGSYDDTALTGLRSALTNRINAAKSGKTFSADGLLDTDTVDNTSIQTQKKGLFKKEKYVEQDNTEWAKYYLNKLVGQLKPYQQEDTTSSKDWDISKHGFEAYLKGQGLDARDVFEKYDLRDENNPDAARSYTQRDEQLRKHLGNYKTWLEGKGFDFTKNDNEWDDNYMSTLDSVINGDWSDRTALAASLRKLGAGDGYTTAFTSDRWDLTKSNADMAAEAKQAESDKKVNEERDKYAQFARDQYSAFKGLSDNNLGGVTYFTSSGDGLFDMSDSEYEKWLNTHTNDSDAYMRQLQENYYKNPFDTKIAGEYLPLAGRFGALKEVNIDGKTWYYDPKTIDRNKNRLVVFNKETGETKHAFLGDIAEEWNAIKRKWRIDNGYEDEAERYTQYNEKGGVLSMQTGGGFNLAQAVNRDLEERNKIRASETGNTEETQEARDRVVSNGDQNFKSEKDSIAQPNAGFTGAEVARLTSIGADIVSMVLDPITGTAVGLGSSALNFGADIADDGFQLRDVWNLGVNIGFDLLGAIPMFGDALGTGSKITRNLVKWAPRIMASMAAFQGVQNFDGMMSSLSKFMSGDKEQKLTVQDWRNIAQSISLVTGGVRAIRNKAQQNKMRNEARVDGVLGVNVTNKKTGDIEQILVDGKTADQIRNTKGDDTEVAKILNDLDAYKGKFGENGDFVVNTKNNGSWQSPVHRRELQNGSGKKEWEYRGFRQKGKADVNEVYDFRRVTAGYGAGRGFKIPWFSNKVNQLHQNLVSQVNSNKALTTVDQKGKLTNKAFEAEQTKLLNSQGVEAQIDKVKDAVATRKKYLEDLQGRITGTEGELATAVAQQADAVAIQSLQKSLDALRRRQTSHDPSTAHTRAYQDLEAMLNSLRTSNPTIGGKTINWDMDAILQKYGVNASDVFKQGGSINRSKINKFLNYGKR